jgi:hypothetical protein
VRITYSYPVRPAGISATEEEMLRAQTRRNEAVAFLIELGFPAPVVALSGNGAHALWPIDLPNDEDSTRLIERGLNALAARFTDQAVTCDEAVFNAARIWKLYGGLRVEPLGEAEVIARLTALHAAIPKVEPLALAGHFSPGELRTIAWHAEDAGRSDDDAPSKLSGTLGAGRIRGCAGT